MRRPPVLLGLLLRLFPRDFRDRHGRELSRDYPGPEDDTGTRARMIYWGRAAVDMGSALAGVWWDRWTERTGPTSARGQGGEGIMMESLRSDTRHALRGLLRAPAFTAMSVLTIALGLGATAAIFSVVHGVLLRPLPYDDPGELTRVWGRFLPESGFDFAYFALDPTEYLDLRDNTRSFESVAAHGYMPAALTASGGEAAERRVGLATTWNLFELLGTEAAMGRTLTPEDDVEDGPNVVVLSHDLWSTRFGADPVVVGRTIQVNRRSYEVVGVLPAGFHFPRADVDLYVPLGLGSNPSNRQSHYLDVVARRRAGVTLEEAEADVSRLMAAWAVEYPEIHTGHFLFLEDFRDSVVQGVRPALMLVMGAVAFVLFVACANVANLLLVRGHARAGEVAVRRALGASRARIAQFRVVESLIVALVGAGIGIALAAVGVPGLLALSDGTVPYTEAVQLDLTVLGFTSLLALVAALVFGLAPVLAPGVEEMSGQLREDGRGGSGSRNRVRFRNGLIAVEVALSCMLVIGAGLMIRSLGNLMAEDPGFETGGRLVADFSLPSAAYPEAGAGSDFLDEVVLEAESFPGIRAVTHVSHLPMRGGQSANDFALEGIPQPGPGQPAWNAGVAMVRANYFDVMGIEVVQGRAFDPSVDRVEGEPVAVVSRALADRFLSGSDPLGQRMRFAGGDDLPWWTIVGVVEDVQWAGLGSAGLPVYYLLTEQIPLYGGAGGMDRFGTLVVEASAAGPLALAEPLRRAVASVDPDVPLTNVAALEDVVRDSVARSRFVMVLMGVFAGLALVLGAVGIYGVTSFVVSERTREIGVRKALGAASGEVMALVVRQGMTTVAVGLALGLVGALSLGRLIASLLYGVEPVDPGTYAAVVGVLAAVAVAALWLPARRAAGLDPMVSLRPE